MAIYYCILALLLAVSAVAAPARSNAWSTAIGSTNIDEGFVSPTNLNRFITNVARAANLNLVTNSYGNATNLHTENLTNTGNFHHQGGTAYFDDGIEAAGGFNAGWAGQFTGNGAGLSNLTSTGTGSTNLSDSGDDVALKWAGQFIGNGAGLTNLPSAEATNAIGNLDGLGTNTTFWPSNGGSVAATFNGEMHGNGVGVTNLPSPSKAELDYPITLTTPDGTNTVTHPNVLHLSTNWNGYPWWLVYTPFPPNAREFPCIAVSVDGYNWTTPTGLVNPIVAAPLIDGVTTWCADTDIILLTNGTMCVYYMDYSYLADATRSNNVMRTESADGINWSTPEPVIQSFGTATDFNIISPAVEFDLAGVMQMYVSCGTNTKSLDLWTASDHFGTNWSGPITCTNSAGAASGAYWHLDVKRIYDTWYLFASTTGGSDLIYQSSTNGVLWASAAGSGLFAPTNSYNSWIGPFYKPTMAVSHYYPLRWDIFSGLAHTNVAYGTSGWKLFGMRDVEFPQKLFFGEQVDGWLDVRGNQTNTGTTALNGLVGVNGVTTYALTVAPSSGQTNILRLRNAAGGDRLVFGAETGLGIRDTTPDALIEVSSDGATSLNPFMASLNDALDGDLVLFKGIGVNGFGTTNPMARLHVNGSAIVTNNLWAENVYSSNNIVGSWYGQFYGNGAGLSNVTATATDSYHPTNVYALTFADDTATWPNSLRLVASAGISFVTNGSDLEIVGSAGDLTDATNETARVAAELTNYVALVSGETTNEVARVADELTNHVSLVAGQTTNHVTLLSTQGTNETARVAAELTNHVALIASQTTNHADALSADATNEAARAALDATNLLATRLTADLNAASNAVSLLITNHGTAVSNGAIAFAGSITNNNLYTWATAPTNSYLQTNAIGAGLIYTNGTLAVTVAPGTGSGSTNVADLAGYTAISNSPTLFGAVTNRAPLSGVQFVVSTNAADGDPVVPPLSVVNGYVGVRNVNPIYVLDVTGNIGASTSISAGTHLTLGGANYLTWSTRTVIQAPASGCLKVSDSAQSRNSLVINNVAKLLTDESVNSIITITSRTNSFVGGKIVYSVFATDNTDRQVVSGEVNYSAVNVNGVWFGTNCTEVLANTSTSVSSGTITNAWTMGPASLGGTTNVTIAVAPWSSLVPAANQCYILWQVQNNGTNVITAIP